MNISRFSKYAKGDMSPLFKPPVGESRAGRLTGDHEYTGQEGDVSVVLDLVDVDTGEEWSWRASAWHAAEQLAHIDPQPEDVIKIERLPDSGKSHQFRITILERRSAGPDPDVNADDPLPF